MGLYLDNGYLDFEYLLSKKQPFIWIIGGRGVGKTYGALSFVLDSKKKFMLMRRTGKQSNLIKNPNYSPFNAVCKDKNEFVTTVTDGENLGAVYKCDYDEKGKAVPHGSPIGNICALSTVANMRGFDGSNTEYLIFDEFIRTAQERPIKNEAEAFANVYETINRNRELKGDSPLTAIMLSNSNELANDYFMQFGLVKYYIDMRKRGQEVMVIPEKGCLLVDIQKSDVSEKKAKTALYKLAGMDSDIAKMALNNEFTSDDFSDIKSYKLNQFTPLVTVGDVTIYAPKTKGGYYYASPVQSGKVDRYDPTGTGKTQFLQHYRYLITYYYRGLFKFEDYVTKALLLTVWDI